MNAIDSSPAAAEVQITDPVSIVLVDDDPYQLSFLAALVSELRPNWRIAAKLSSLENMVDLIADLQPSLCILDVVFPGATSLSMVRQIEDMCPVVFVTGNELHAVQAFDCDAVDYVMKPLRPERLEQALRKAEAALAMNAGRLQRAGRADVSASSSIRFLRGQDLVWSPLSSVQYFQAQRKYSRVVLKDQEGLLRLGLNLVQQHLKPTDFIRIHRGLIVNVNHIEGARRDDFGRLVVRMAGRDDKLIVAKPYEHLFRDGFS
jgi:DNA-binding LytR/AlgR family response regulator